MASGAEWSCPICCNALDDIAYSTPCRHQFCLGCILCWVRENRACPLCRTPILSLSFSEQEEVSRESPKASIQAGNAPGSLNENTHGASLASTLQGTLSPAGQGAAGPEAVAGILPELWAELFRRRGNLLDPVRTWLQQWLERIYEDRWWQVKVAESSVLLALCMFGPDREALVQRLQLPLQEHTAQLVHDMVNIIETQCSQEVRRLRRFHAPRPKGQSPGDSSIPTASQGCVPASSGLPDSSGQEEAGTPEVALQGSPRCTTPGEQP